MTCQNVRFLLSSEHNKGRGLRSTRLGALFRKLGVLSKNLAYCCTEHSAALKATQKEENMRKGESMGKGTWIFSKVLCCSVGVISPENRAIKHSERYVLVTP